MQTYPWNSLHAVGIGDYFSKLHHMSLGYFDPANALFSNTKSHFPGNLADTIAKTKTLVCVVRGQHDGNKIGHG